MVDVTSSVAMCTRNGEAYLGRQLDSILNGTRLPDEIVIMDDASRDGTARILDEFSSLARSRGITVRVERHPEALGVSANFERAVRACSGDIIVFSDQDDVWHADRLAAAIAAHEAREDLWLLHGDAVIVGPDGAPSGDTLFRRLEVSRDELREVASGRAFDVYLRRNLATGATMSIRRELLASALPFPDSWLHDEWLAVIAAAHGAVAIESRPRIDYRVHDGNEVGAARPTIRRKVERVFAADPGRNLTLSRRAQILADRLSLDGGLDAFVRAATRKAQFEEQRSALPRLRLARLSRVVRWLLSGTYRELASRRNWDAVRDLLRS